MNKIIYLDAAASMQKPTDVINAELDFLRCHYANAGRGVCARVSDVDLMLHNVRGKVAKFIGTTPDKIVFTNGATDALNRVTNIITEKNIRVAVSDLDHNSARIPWEKRQNTHIINWPLDSNMNLNTDKVPVADVYLVTAMSNVLGVGQNIPNIIREIRKKNASAKIVVDAAQYVVHEKIDATLWNADFICFSGHKIGADTGVGVMYIKNPDLYSPDKFGGGMVQSVTDSDIKFVTGISKFEAGTLPLTQIVGLGVAVDYILQNRPDKRLGQYMYDEFAKLPKIKIITNRDAAVLTFVVDGMHALDFGMLVGARGVCLRVGNMCAPWIHKLIGFDATIRLSLGMQSDLDDVRTTVEIIKDVIK